MIRLSEFICVIVCMLLPATWGSALRAKGANKLGIYGGHAISIEEAPYMAALFGNYYGFNFFCGGSIIHEYFILTANHCYRSIHDASSTRVLVGANNVNKMDGVFFDVEKKICYKYSLFGNSDDICLLKLKEAIQFGAKVAKIILADEEYTLEEGVPAQVTGWGVSDNPYEFGTLRQVTVPIQPQDSCRKIYEGFSDKMVCAGSPRHDACWGDSGGPLTHNGIQIGLVSFGSGCGNYSSVYTRISSYVKWINSTIAKNLS